MNVGGILITHNSNTHPPESWAVSTARRIFDVGNDVPSSRRIPALKFQTALAEILVGHHTKVQTDEQARLDADASSYMNMHHDVADYVNAAMVDIAKLSEGTPWESDTHTASMQDQIKAVLHADFATSQHIQRQAHARAHPEVVAGQAFLRQLHGGEG